MKKTDKEQVYLDIIKILSAERDKYEYRYKHQLPEGWMYADEHPRIGELICINNYIEKRNLGICNNPK